MWRDGSQIPLTPKAFSVLFTLVSNSGRTLLKDELLREVWPDQFVEENNLADNISTLRRVLGDDAKEPRYIKTVPRRGYRFVADVREMQDEGVELVVAEHTRARIVIEEESEPDSDMHLAEVVAASEHKPLIAGPRASHHARRNERTLLLMAVGTLLIIAAVSAYLYRAARRVPTAENGAQIRSIAVLPFKPLIASERDESLELGMAETLITRFSNINQFTVRQTSAVRKYTDPQQDALAAGRELMVDSVLDGTIQKAGDQLRVTARLIRVSDGTTIWADKFDTEFKDIFTVQDSISERVAAALATKLSGEEKKGLSRRYTDSVEAYQLYLKGRAHWRMFNPQDLLTSINYYRAALEKDPNYALAYTGIASAYSVIGIYGPLTAKEAMPKAKEAAQKAIELDDNLSQGHMALGLEKLLHEWDWDGARRELERAIELDPNSDGHAPYGYYLEAMRRSDESLAELKRARDLAPGWDIANTDYAWHLFIERHYDEAIAVSEQELKLDPENPGFYMVLGMTHTQQGKYGEAITELQRAVAIGSQIDPVAGMTSEAELGVAYALMGRRQDALRQAAEIQKSPISWTPFWVAEIYTALGDKEAAFAWLEKGYEARCPFLWEIRSYQQFEPLRSDPRYASLLRRMNLSP